MGRALLQWDEWAPGLDTGHMTLAEVLATMPAANAEDVPEIIRRYENPESPEALPGSISLERHDCIHAILGRGLHVQDEAFIIGATMGAASDFTDEAKAFFIKVSTTQYPEHWRFEEDHIASYRLGVGYAEDHSGMRDIHLIPLETAPWQSRLVSDIRKEMGLSVEEMRAYYRAETLLVPGSRATTRLDTSAKRIDQALR